MTRIEPFRREGHSYLQKKHDPILPVLDTQEVLERISKNWVNPGPNRRHNPRMIDSLMYGLGQFLFTSFEGA